MTVSHVDRASNDIRDALLLRLPRAEAKEGDARASVQAAHGRQCARRHDDEWGRGRRENENKEKWVSGVSNKYGTNPDLFLDWRKNKRKITGKSEENQLDINTEMTQK